MNNLVSPLGWVLCLYSGLSYPIIISSSSSSSLFFLFFFLSKSNGRRRRLVHYTIVFIRGSGECPKRRKRDFPGAVCPKSCSKMVVTMNHNAIIFSLVSLLLSPLLCSMYWIDFLLCRQGSYKTLHQSEGTGDRRSFYSIVVVVWFFLPLAVMSP